MLKINGLIKCQLGVNIQFKMEIRLLMVVSGIPLININGKINNLLDPGTLKFMKVI